MIGCEKSFPCHLHFATLSQSKKTQINLPIWLFLFVYIFRFPEFSKFLSTYGAIASGVPLLLTAYVCREYVSHSEFRNIYNLCVMGPILMACGIIFFAQVRAFWYVPFSLMLF